jgi:hypothetical protein
MLGWMVVAALLLGMSIGRAAGRRAGPVVNDPGSLIPHRGSLIVNPASLAGDRRPAIRD